MEKDLNLYLLEGHWFVSFYNDYGDSQRLSLTASAAPDLTEGCPSGCSGPNGDCVDGRCVCKAGFGGEDCAEGELKLSALGNVTLYLCGQAAPREM